MQFKKRGLPMSSNGMRSVCEALNVGEPEVWAVLTVETRGFGYLSDRRPQILFERHIFSRRTNGAFDKAHPGISSGAPGGYQGGAAEYKRLAEAIDLNEDEALKSASWGLPQVMGFNHRVVGFENVQNMVDAMVESEDRQLEALGNFIMASPMCRIGIQRRDWATFAACYNGKDFRKNDYDSRLAAAYEKNKAMLPDIGLRGAQVGLTFLGFDCGTIDGIRGRRTRSAMAEFQTQNGLPATGELDEATEQKLTERAFPA